jgi:hypothetical protein
MNEVYLIARPSNTDIVHYGKAHDNNPPGRGSGRYAWGSKIKTALSSDKAKVAYRVGLVAALGTFDVIGGMSVYGAALKSIARAGSAAISPILSKVGTKVIANGPTLFDSYKEISTIVPYMIYDAIRTIPL